LTADQNRKPGLLGHNTKEEDVEKVSQVSSVPANPFEDKLNEIKAHGETKRARRFDKSAKVVIWGATDLVAVTALALGAWSNQTVAHWLGVPGPAGWAAALVIDGIWLVSLAIVQLHRKEPWRALTAYQATLWMVGLSALTNFAHGLIQFGATWRGFAAGLAFALLPVGLKWLVSVSTKNNMSNLLRAPDARNRIKQAGQISAELELNEVLNPVVQRLNSAAEPTVPADQVWYPPVTFGSTPVQLERVEPEPEFDIPDWVNQRAEPVRIENHAKPELEPAKVHEVPRVETPVAGSRQERVADLAQKIAERGGQLDSVTFADLSQWYGVDPSKKSTLSALRKAGHQAYLDGAKTGQYL
jgi:hypothetical protein